MLAPGWSTARLHSEQASTIAGDDKMRELADRLFRVYEQRSFTEQCRLIMELYDPNATYEDNYTLVQVGAGGRRMHLDGRMGDMFWLRVAQVLGLRQGRVDAAVMCRCSQWCLSALRLLDTP
jgi:hypothetical protein